MELSPAIIIPPIINRKYLYLKIIAFLFQLLLAHLWCAYAMV